MKLKPFKKHNTDYAALWKLIGVFIVVAFIIGGVYFLSPSADILLAG